MLRILVLLLITHVIGGNPKLMTVRESERGFHIFKKQESNVIDANVIDSNDVEDLDSSCFKLSKELITTAAEEEKAFRTLALYSSQFNGKEVYYRIENTPLCTELNKEEIRSAIDRAANEWNKRTTANVLLLNIEDKDSSEFISNEISSENSEEYIITISFELCKHLKSTRYADSVMEEFGKNCNDTFAHAHDYSSIHLNTRMTWTDKTFTADGLIEGDLMRPNLFNIALHEFGHVLGLGHTGDDPRYLNDVMHYHFGGIRAFLPLSLSTNDIRRLEARYPVKPCGDDSPYCEDTSCNSPSEVDYCQKTCNLCDLCGANYVDDYVKCVPTICLDLQSPFREYCRKTCRDCEREQEACTGLPPDTEHMKTNVTFPVPAGTQIKVRCERGWEVDGDDVITCVTRDQYTWEIEMPECDKPDEVLICEDRRSLRQCSKLKGRGKCGKRKVIKSCKKTCGKC